MGGTMRLGAYECVIDPNSKTYEAYQSSMSPCGFLCWALSEPLFEISMGFMLF